MSPTDEAQTAYVYLIHFDRPFHHARHYIGTTRDLRTRLISHAQGRGANIIKAAMAAGITWRLAAIGACDASEMFALERRLKNWKGCEGQCLYCMNGDEGAIPGTTPICLSLARFPHDSTTLAQETQ